MYLNRRVSGSADILVLEANPYEDGNDYIIGDIHGNAACLKQVLKKLQPHDRLFMVGDLADRGENSLEVLALCNSPEYKDRLYAVRGNHEEMCLTTIRILETYASKLTLAESKVALNRVLNEMETVNEIAGHEMNGGAWLKRLFLQEIGHEVASDPISFFIPGYPLTDHNIQKIQIFMKSLPYLVLVKGSDTKRPFVVVHADNPLTIEELLKRVTEDKGLTPEEKTYATWERRSPGHPSDEIGNSIATYCGHTPVVNQQPPYPIRPQTNTIDVDVGACFYGVLLQLNHTQNTAEYVHQAAQENKNFINKRDVFAEILSDVKKYLKLRNTPFHQAALKKLA